METLITIMTICMVLWTVLMAMAAIWSWTQYKVYKKMTEEILDKEW